MFYLIFCSLILLVDVVSFILCMLPLVTIEMIPYSELLGSYSKYSYTMLDFLSSSYGIFSFSFTIISIIFITILMVHSIKVYSCKSDGVKFSFIFNIITFFILIAQLLFFVRFKNNTGYTSGMTDNFYYYYYRRQTILVNVILIMDIFCIAISLLMIVIAGVYTFSDKNKKKKFFTLAGEKRITEQGNSKGIVSEKNIEMDNIAVLMKLNELKKDGAITEEEFNEKKKELL